MGKKDKNKKKGKGAEKTTMKTEKKASLKQKKMLEKMGEVRVPQKSHAGWCDVKISSHRYRRYLS